MIGRNVPAIPRLLKTAVGHRGPLHSFLFAGIFTALFVFLIHTTPATGIAFFAGYVSHILLDALNPQRVPAFWPLKLRIGIGLVNSCGILERYLFMPAVFLCLVWILYPVGKNLRI
jgi:inner membrane protein